MSAETKNPNGKVRAARGIKRTGLPDNHFNTLPVYPNRGCGPDGHLWQHWNNHFDITK